MFVAFQKSPKPVAVFKLPDFPDSTSFLSTRNYYCSLIQLLDEEMFSVQSENPSLLARFFFLRGFSNVLCSRRLDALVDFQNLYRTDTSIFPAGLVTWLVESLREDERHLADRRPDLKRLLLKVSLGAPGFIWYQSQPTLKALTSAVGSVRCSWRARSCRRSLTTASRSSNFPGSRCTGRSLCTVSRRVRL